MYNFEELFGQFSNGFIEFGINDLLIKENFGIEYFNRISGIKWNVYDLQQFLTIINEFYNALLAAVIKVRLDEKIFHDEFKKVDYSTKKRIIKLTTFEDILLTIKDYVPENFHLKVLNIQSASNIKMSFEGLGDLAKALFEFLRNRRFDQINYLLRLSEISGNDPLIIYHRKIVETKLKKKLLKELKKLRRLEQKYGISPLKEQDGY